MAAMPDGRTYNALSYIQYSIIQVMLATPCKKWSIFNNILVRTFDYAMCCCSGCTALGLLPNNKMANTSFIVDQYFYFYTIVLQCSFIKSYDIC